MITSGHIVPRRRAGPQAGAERGECVEQWYRDRDADDLIFGDDRIEY